MARRAYSLKCTYFEIGARKKSVNNAISVGGKFFGNKQGDPTLVNIIEILNPSCTLRLAKYLRRLNLLDIEVGNYQATSTLLTISEGDGISIRSFDKDAL